MMRRQSLQMGFTDARTFMEEKKDNDEPRLLCLVLWCPLSVLSERKRLIGTETVDNASFFQIVGSHFDLHTIPRQYANAVYPHPSCESAMELMVLCLGAYDFDAECGIWKGFFDNADQFNDVFRHKSLNKVKPKNPTERKSLQQALSLQNFLHSPKIYCQKLVLVYRCNLRR